MIKRHKWILLLGNLKSNKGGNICVNNIKLDRSVLREVTVNSTIGTQRR